MAYVLAMEMVGLVLCSALYSGQQVGPRWRVVAGTLCQWYQVLASTVLYYVCTGLQTLGYLLAAGVAYLLNHDWQLLQVVLCLPCLLFLSYWWIVPESVRWLLSQGRHTQARLLLNQVKPFT